MKTILLGFFLLSLTLNVSAQEFWSARRLEVHEWGVSQFDWSPGRDVVTEFPDFFYTDRLPGASLGPSRERVKDMEADSGMRVWTKPVLYFYGPDSLRGRGNNAAIPVGVEVRFKDGRPIAWWPQVNVHRTPGETAKAKAPDLIGWNQRRMGQFQAYLKERLSSEQFKKVWSYNEDREFIPNEPGFGVENFGGMKPFPEDERFQLTWDRLTLTQKPPEGRALRGEDLPEAHWVKLARQVDSDYVSNGRESEKFLFYEGRTPEAPVIALVPNTSRLAARPSFQVFNVSGHPIFDVFLVYREKAKGLFWAQYVPELIPLEKRERDPAGQQSRPHLVAPIIPYFQTKQTLQKTEFIEEEEFHRRTDLQLSNALVMSAFLPDEIYTEHRNPAQ